MNTISYICNMKEFTSHIDYLIQKHDCVIIPDFGGFVLNREVAKIATDGSIAPPRVTVGFNPDLKYNDGLLAESYMNAYSISYDTACKRIDEVTKRLNTILALKQPVQIGLLGKLSPDEDGRLIFEPNNNISASHSETFGLSVLDIRKLVDIHEVQKVLVINNKRSVYKKVFAGVGAAVAAILVFFVASTPILEDKGTSVQKSGFFTDLIILSSANRPGTVPAVSSLTIASSVEVEAKKEEPKIDITPVVAQKAESAKADKTAPVTVKQADPKYFVIIGSATSKSEAEKALKKFKMQGYQNANVINSGDRSRIYIASFEDRVQAEKYLASFVKNNPKLDDAWVFAKRN